MRNQVTATFVGGWRCGRTVAVDPDAAPAEIFDHASSGLYRLIERTTAAGLPVYAYEPPRAAPERGACRCGCRRAVTA